MEKNKTQKERGYKKSIIGTVISSKGNKTISVKTQNSVRHSKYKKYILKDSFFVAHDKKNQAKVTDKVQIVSIRPLSKTKRWKLSRVIRSSEGEL